MRTTDWKELVTEYQSSGETQSAFCRRVGVSASALQYHLKKLERRTNPEGSGSFIRIGEPIEIDLPMGARVRIPASAEMLKVLLEVCGAVTR